MADLGDASPAGEEKTTNEGNDSKEISASVRRKINQMIRAKPHNASNLIHNTDMDLNCSRFKVPASVIPKAEWKFSLPTPVFTSSYGFLEIDPICRRVGEHRSYQNRLRWIPHAYKKCEAKKVYRNARKRGVYSWNILNYAQLLEQDPDEYFSGRYDWFYTGGNLETFDCGNEKYVVHATGKRLQDLNVSKAEMDFTHMKLTNISRKRSKVLINGNANPEILEIQHLNGTNLSVRRRNYLSLYTYENDTLKYRFHLHNKTVPFISSTKESPTSANIITSDLDKTVALWDLNTSAEIPKQLLLRVNPIAKNANWNCVRYIDNNIYAFVDFNNFYMLDSRQSLEENKSVFSVNCLSEKCEKITTISSSHFNDLIYLATTHKLLALDRRYMKTNLSGSTKPCVLRWTHQMNGFPLMMRTTLFDDVEAILMASYLNGDIRICQNNRISLENKETVYNSPKLPIRPPSINEAYRNARLEGFCLFPYTSMEQRLNYSHSGICFINCNEMRSLLTSNSNGDIFSQVVVDAHEVDMVNEDNLAAMKQWEDTLLDIDTKNRPPLNVTNVGNLESLKKIFRCNQLDSCHKDNERIDEYATTTPRPGKWQRPIKTLQRYKDALAADLLSIWDIETEDKDGKVGRLVLPEQEVASVSAAAVDQWLEQNTIAVADDSIFDSMNIGLDETISASVVGEQIVTQKKEKKVSKKRYVKGF